MSASDDFLSAFSKVTGTGSFHTYGSVPFFLPSIHVEGVDALGEQDTGKLSRSMRIAMEDLKLMELLVVYPGPKEYALAENIHAVPLASASGAANGA